MKYIAFIITSALLRLVALLPNFILYLLSDILYFILYYLIAYRKEVSYRNLRNSFPELSGKEIKRLAKKFYRHLADIIIENAVIQFWPERRLRHMFRCTNPEIIDRYYEKGRDIILITGHYCNWEWASPLSLTIKHLVIGVYKPLRNKYFDRAYRKARTRFGAVAVPMGSIGRALFEYKEKEIPTLTGMVGDQRPIRKHIQYWTDFLGQKTAVFTGSEKLAKKFNAVVVFMKVRRIKRGVYQAEIELVTDTPNETSANEITEKHTRILEKLILEDPSSWLWSHNRWKISYERWIELGGG